MDKNSKAKTLLKEEQEGQFVLDMIVTMETPGADVTSLAASANTKVKLFSEIEENGKYNLRRFVVISLNLEAYALDKENLARNSSDSFHSL